MIDHPGLAQVFAARPQKRVVVFIEQPFAQRFYSIFGQSLAVRWPECQLHVYSSALRYSSLWIQDELARRMYFLYHQR